MVMCCLPTLTAVARPDQTLIGVQFDQLELLRFLGDNFGPMNAMCERPSLSKRAVYDRTKAVMEFFGFPFDTPPV